MLHGVVAWVVAWLLHGCCMVVAWKNSSPVRRVSSESSYAVVPGLVGGPCVGLDCCYAKSVQDTPLLGPS